MRPLSPLSAPSPSPTIEIPTSIPLQTRKLPGTHLPPSGSPVLSLTPRRSTLFHPAPNKQLSHPSPPYSIHRTQTTRWLPLSHRPFPPNKPNKPLPFCLFFSGAASILIPCFQFPQIFPLVPLCLSLRPAQRHLPLHWAVRGTMAVALVTALHSSP
ncbi:uncharacterized protein BDW43DRAFT_239010 [Aspergillus alliaceus]|uniref:uncharacterized protein n=1 Tax=Petromyces alliaceus TaxID=209559 RepID=UPI0012A6A948|nr:uncharacterized protein BDW43DRAFT_239010 [Aspergillus alliaceus]KAB8227665.1 hypothetical protein BDW43DRAFT_239010 [Aspergillus alliaceus]